MSEEKSDATTTTMEQEDIKTTKVKSHPWGETKAVEVSPWNSFKEFITSVSHSRMNIFVILFILEAMGLALAISGVSSWVSSSFLLFILVLTGWLFYLVRKKDAYGKGIELTLDQ